MKMSSKQCYFHSKRKSIVKMKALPTHLSHPQSGFGKESTPSPEDKRPD